MPTNPSIRLYLESNQCMQPFRVELGLIGQGGGHFLLLCDLTLAATLPDDREREPPITDIPAKIDRPAENEHLRTLSAADLTAKWVL